MAAIWHLEFVKLRSLLEGIWLIEVMRFERQEIRPIRYTNSIFQEEEDLYTLKKD